MHTLEDVEADDSYVGVAIGRTANRIRGGTFCFEDGTQVVLECNENGQNHIHGGRCGWSNKLFAIRDVSESAVELFMLSPDRDQGYPSSVEVSMRFELTGRGELAIALTSTNVGDETTATNMTVRRYACTSSKSSPRERLVSVYVNPSNIVDDYFHSPPTGPSIF